MILATGLVIFARDAHIICMLPSGRDDDLSLVRDTGSQHAETEDEIEEEMCSRVLNKFVYRNRHARNITRARA